MRDSDGWMGIQLLEISYQKADIGVRELFSFTKSEAAKFLQILKQKDGAAGAVLLSTCNRTQLWLSHTPECEVDLMDELFRYKQCDRYREKYAVFFDKYAGEDAVGELFALASGLRSQIMGEDQILAQVKEALAKAREIYCTDQVLEVLFRMAVTAGKEVKSQYPIRMGNASAPLASIEYLEQMGYRFAGKKCLVIGNGMMGRLTAQLLVERTADVTVTIRQYRSGVVDVPLGVKRIDYGRRYEYLPQCDFVFSATASPNLTIRQEELQKIAFEGEKVFVDLAVPRDIESKIREFGRVKLFDMDSFQLAGISGETEKQINRINEFLREKRQEYVVWYGARNAIPELFELSVKASRDVAARIKKPLKKKAVWQPEVEQEIEQAVQKVVRKLFFGIRDSVDDTVFRECLEALRGLYQEQGDDSVE